MANALYRFQRLLMCLCIPALLTGVCASFSFAADDGHSSPSLEPGWQSTITQHRLTPVRLVAVEKNSQTIFLYEKQSPQKLIHRFTCTTGQATGDKLVRGDLKTPEGIYFIMRKLSGGLDFAKYGKEAYILNYPNPVDKLRNKTGYGIWIHGRGAPIVPRETEGCVALNNGDLDVFGQKLDAGTPVKVAATLKQPPALSPTEKDQLAVLEKLTYSWAKAWSNRSVKLFDYYDSEAYSVAQGEAFSAFRSQKERLFKSLPWIDTKIRHVQVLEGPGYWVTWFQQDYKAPNLSTAGVRRLYWQQNKKGEFRIVGMEWAPHLSGTLVASRGDADGSGDDIPILSDEPPLAEGDARLMAAAVRPPAGGTPAPSPEADAAPRPGAPAMTEKASPPAAATGVENAATPPATPPVAAPAAGAALAVVESGKTPSALTPPPASGIIHKLDPVEMLAAEGAAFIEHWRKAWEHGDVTAYMGCYAPEAVQGNRQGASAIETHKRKSWKTTPPTEVVLSNIRITPSEKIITAEMMQVYKDYSGYKDKGRKILTLRKDGGSWKIIREDWRAL